MFSWPNKWEHARFGRIKTSVELARKNIADYIANFLCNTKTRKLPLPQKQTISASERLKKKIGQCRLKNISGDYFTTDVDCCFFYSIAE